MSNAASWQGAARSDPARRPSAPDSRGADRPSRAPARARPCAPPAPRAAQIFDNASAAIGKLIEPRDEHRPLTRRTLRRQQVAHSQGRGRAATSEERDPHRDARNERTPIVHPSDPSKALATVRRRPVIAQTMHAVEADALGPSLGSHAPSQRAQALRGRLAGPQTSREIFRPSSLYRR